MKERWLMLRYIITDNVDNYCFNPHYQYFFQKITFEGWPVFQKPKSKIDYPRNLLW